MRDILQRLRRQESGPLDPEGRLASELWIDKKTAPRQININRLRRKITKEQAENLRYFYKHGYMVIPLEDFHADITTKIDADVDRLWRERPADVAYAYHSLLRPFAQASEEHRKPSCRVADLHTYSETAQSLFLHPKIFDYIELIFGQPAVATQSLYFEWGSQQALHRDPVYVQMSRPNHLLAAWIALEDISLECGPLVYIPGSHRLPYYQYEPGRFTADFSRDGEEQVRASEAWDAEQCKAAGLALKTFSCRRGDVLIWHHSLLHGGSLPQKPELTRKSFVVHYSTLSTMPQVQNSYEIAGTDGEVQLLSSERLIQRGDRRGFDSPLHVAGRVTPALHSTGSEPTEC